MPSERVHEPGCIDLYDELDGLCICDRLRAAWRDGYNSHARSMAMWEATNGGAEVHVHYIQHGEGTNP